MIHTHNKHHTGNETLANIKVALTNVQRNDAASSYNKAKKQQQQAKAAKEKQDKEHEKFWKVKGFTEELTNSICSLALHNKKWHTAWLQMKTYYTVGAGTDTSTDLKRELENIHISEYQSETLQHMLSRLPTAEANHQIVRQDEEHFPPINNTLIPPAPYRDEEWKLTREEYSAHVFHRDQAIYNIKANAKLYREEGTRLETMMMALQQGPKHPFPTVFQDFNDRWRYENHRKPTMNLKQYVDDVKQRDLTFPHEKRVTVNRLLDRKINKPPKAAPSKLKPLIQQLNDKESRHCDLCYQHTPDQVTRMDQNKFLHESHNTDMCRIHQQETATEPTSKRKHIDGGKGGKVNDGKGKERKVVFSQSAGGSVTKKPPLQSAASTLKVNVNSLNDDANQYNTSDNDGDNEEEEDDEQDDNSESDEE